MDNIRLNKRIMKKIAILLLVIMLCNFALPTHTTYANSWLAKSGGIILEQVLGVLMFVGDTVLDIMQKNFISLDDVVIKVKSDDYKREPSILAILELVVGVLLIVASIAITIASWGTLSWAGAAGIMAGIKVVCGIIILGVGGTVLAVKGNEKIADALKGEFDLPQIRYTPYEIFSNQVPILDVDFMNPRDPVTVKKNRIEYSESDRNKQDAKDFVRKYGIGPFNIYEYEDKYSVDLSALATDRDNPHLLYDDGPYYSLICSGDAGNIYMINANSIDEIATDPYIEEMAKFMMSDVSPDDSADHVVIYKLELSMRYPDGHILGNSIGYPGNSEMPRGLDHFDESDPFYIGGLIDQEHEEHGLSEGVDLCGDTYKVYVYNEAQINPYYGILVMKSVWGSRTKEIARYGVTTDYAQDADLLTHTGTTVIRHIDETDLVLMIRDDIQEIVTEKIGDVDQTAVDNCKQEIINGLAAYYPEGTQKTYESSAFILQDSIATWYKVLRRVAMVVALSMLVYVGIRIILSSTASGKAKYKKWFFDWVTALCILFILHYIMILILTLSSSICDIFAAKGEPNIFVELPKDTNFVSSEERLVRTRWNI